MTKQETRELDTVKKYHALGYTDTAARALSALIRATRSKTTREQLMVNAHVLGLTNNPDFVI